MENYYNSSAAYDLSMYESKGEAYQRKNSAQPELRVLERRRSGTTQAVAPIRVLASLVAVGTVVCSLIFNRVRLMEVNGSISACKKELTILKSENVELKSALEEAMSLDSLEGDTAAIIEQKNMTKINKNQVRYVILSTEDEATATEKDESVLGWFKGIFGSAKSYIQK